VIRSFNSMAYIRTEFYASVARRKKPGIVVVKSP
jgi:hypothetical protein